MREVDATNEYPRQHTQSQSGRPPTQPPRVDTGTIKRALEILVVPGSVVELRIPRTPHQGTVSGYFNNLGRMAESAATMSGKAEGVYLSLNPVKPDLIARASNRLVPAKHTTSDRDVVRLRWFLVDFDPVRPAGISSTDSEHEATMERARACREWLRSQGWPEPVFADSGNGAHLDYRINLPNDDQSAQVLKSCLIALGMPFTDSTVEVDLTTYNAARIVKGYGTVAAKAKHTLEGQTAETAIPACELRGKRRSG